MLALYLRNEQDIKIMNKKRLTLLTLAIWIMTSFNGEGNPAQYGFGYILGYALGRILMSFVIALLIEWLLSKFLPGKKKKK